MAQVFKGQGRSGVIRPQLKIVPSDAGTIGGWWSARNPGNTITSGKVQQLTALAGSAGNFTQATAGNRPIYNATGGPNNLPYFSGDGVGAYLTSSFTPGANGTFIVVCRHNRTPLGEAANGQLDAIFDASDSSFSGLRLELFNWYNDPNIRSIQGSCGSGSVASYRDGTVIGGLNSTLYIGPNRWHIATFTWSGVTTPGNLSPMKLLANLSGSAYSLNDIAEILYFPAVLSTTNRLLAESYLAHTYKLPHFATSRRVLALLGDSITEGYGLPYESSWPYLLHQSLGFDPNLFIYNAAVSGDTLLQLESRAADVTGVDNLTFGGNTIPARPLVCYDIFAGTNDIYVSSDTAATAYSRLNTVVTNRKNTGKADYIMCTTSIPRGTSTTGWSDYNTLIRNNASALQSAGMTVGGIIDLNTDSAFNDGLDPTDGTNYQDPVADQTHPNATGMGKIAVIKLASYRSVGFI